MARHGRIQPMPGAPWGLTRRQFETLQALIDGGCNKSAARLCNVSVKTIEAHASNALAKSGMRHRLLMLIAFDRATRTEGGAV